MKPLLHKLTWPVGVLVAGALIGALVWLWPSPADSVVDQQQRVAIEQADTARAVVQRRIPVARTKTDKVVADTTSSRPEIQTAVEEERSAADSTIAAADRQIETRDTRIKTLEKRTGGLLFLYSEVGVSSPLDRLKLGFEGEAGIAVKLDQHTRIQLGATSEKELQLKVRRELRLF